MCNIFEELFSFHFIMLVSVAMNLLGCAFPPSENTLLVGKNVLTLSCRTLRKRGIFLRQYIISNIFLDFLRFFVKSPTTNTTLIYRSFQCTNFMNLLLRILSLAGA